MTKRTPVHLLSGLSGVLFCMLCPWRLFLGGHLVVSEDVIEPVVLVVCQALRHHLFGLIRGQPLAFDGDLEGVDVLSVVHNDLLLVIVCACLVPSVVPLSTDVYWNTRVPPLWGGARRLPLVFISGEVWGQYRDSYHMMKRQASMISP